jgi:hypothetical protein
MSQEARIGAGGVAVDRVLDQRQVAFGTRGEIATDAGTRGLSVDTAAKECAEVSDESAEKTELRVGCRGSWPAHLLRSG